MKKLTTILGAATLLLPSIGLFAQESDAVVSQSGNSGNGFFAYADYFQYIGAGAPGALVAAENQASHIAIFSDFSALSASDGIWKSEQFSNGVPYRYYTEHTFTQSNFKFPKTPKGNLAGGTIGYQWKTKNEDKWYAQFSYRSGNIDTTIADYNIAYTSYYKSDYDFDGDIDNTIKFDNKYTASSTYKQDINEYHMMMAYTPSKLSLLTLGLEYAYAKYRGDFYYTGSFNGSTSNTLWNRGFKQSTHDVVAHTTLKSTPISILSIGTGHLFLAPRLDVGAGYSFRSGHKKANTNDTFWIQNVDEMLGQDAWVFEGTATIGTYYNIGSSTILFDVGYRYKTDIDSRQRAGTDQKGVYGRLGYTYSW